MRHGGFIESISDAGDIPYVRDPRENPLKYDPVDDETERAEAEHTRRVSALLAQRDREQNLRDTRWAAFQIAICNLQLSPAQIANRIAELFPVPPEPTPAKMEEEIVSASPAEDD